MYLVHTCSGGFRGGLGGSVEPTFGAKLFQLHREIYEKSGKMLKTNPPLDGFEPPFQESWIRP